MIEMSDRSKPYDADKIFKSLYPTLLFICGTSPGLSVFVHNDGRVAISIGDWCDTKGYDIKGQLQNDYGIDFEDIEVDCEWHPKGSDEPNSGWSVMKESEDRKFKKLDKVKCSCGWEGRYRDYSRHNDLKGWFNIIHDRPSKSSTDDCRIIEVNGKKLESYSQDRKSVV